MDFHAMKRKELQALCKKHKIPANLTNLEMANRLASLLKIEQEKPRKTLGKSCLKGVDELGDVDENADDVKVAKKVRFSPEDQTFVFEKTNPRAVRLAARRRKSMMDEVQIQDEEKVMSVDDPSNLLQKASEKAAADKLVRSRGKNTEQADSAEAELLQAEENNGSKKTSQKRASSLVDSEVLLEDPGDVPQKASEKVVADKRLRSTRSRSRGKKTEQADAAEELLQDGENHGHKITSQKRASGLVDSEVLLGDPGDVPQKASEKVVAGEQVRSTRSRSRGKKTEQADAAEEELLQDGENHGHKKTSQRRATSLVDSEVLLEDPGNMPQVATEKAVADKRARSTRSRGRGKKTEQADAAEEESLQDGENHGCKKKSQKGVSSSVDSEAPTLMDEGEAKGVLRKSSRNAGRSDDLASLAKDVYIVGSPERKTRSDCPPKKQDVEKAPKRGLRSNRLKETHENSVDEAKEDVHETARTTRNTRQKKRARGLDETVSATESDYVAEPPRQRSSRASTRRGLGAHGKLDGNEVIDESEAEIQEAEPPRQRSSRASTGRGLGAHGKVDSNEGFDKSDAEIQEVGFLPSGEKSWKNDNACHPGKSDEPSSRDGMRNSLDAQTDVAGGSPLAKSASDAEDNQNLPYSSSMAAANHQGKDQPLCQYAPTVLLEECEFKNAKEESCKSKTGFGELAEAGNAKTQLKTTSSTGKAVSTGGKQQRNSLFITSKEGTHVDSYISDNQYTEEGFKEADADKQAENINWDTSEGAESLLLPSSGLKSAPRSVASTVSADDNNGMQCDPSLTSNNTEECAGPLSFQGTSQVQNEAASPIYALEEPEFNNASEGEASVSKNKEQDNHASLPSATTINDQCQSAFKTSTVDTVTRTAKEMQDGQELIISGEEGITVDLYNLENQITKYFEAVRSDPFPALLESQTGLHQPTDESAASPLMLNEPLHSQVDECADHDVAKECGNVESKEAVEGSTPSEMLGENSEGADKFFGDIFDDSPMLDQSSKQELDMNGNMAIDTAECTENAFAGSSPVEMLDDASEGAEKFVTGSLDEEIASDGSPEQGLAVKSHLCGNVESKEAVEGSTPSGMLGENSEGADKFFGDIFDNSAMLDQSSKQELDMNGSMTVDTAECTENALEGSSLVEMLDDASEGAEKFVSRSLDEKIVSDESPEQGLAVKSHMAGDTLKSGESEVEGLSPTAMLYQSSEDADKSKSDNEGLDEVIESDGGPKQELAGKSNTAGDVVEPTVNAAERLTPAGVLNETLEGAGLFFSERVDENTESDGSPRQELAKNRGIARDAVESTDKRNVSGDAVESAELAGRIFVEREDENIDSHGIPEQELAMTSNVAGDAVGSTEIAVEVFTPKEMLNEMSEGAEKLIGGSVDENTEPDGSPKQELDMNREIAGGSVESTEAVEGSTHFVVINGNLECAEKFVCGRLNEANESDGIWNQGLAMESDPQPSVHEDTSFEDPEERIDLLPTEGVQRPEVVHGNESSVVYSDPEGGHYMTETSGDEGEGHKEIVKSGEWLCEAEICMEEVDLARETADLTSNGPGCSDLERETDDLTSTGKVRKVSPTSSRFSDRMELVAGSKERRELIRADYLDFKSPGPQSAFNLGNGAFRDEAGETAHQTIQDASDEKISMHLCDYRDNSASNIIEENMTAASEATEGQVPSDCLSSEPETARVRHTLQGEELENIASNEAAVDVSRSPEEKLKSAVKANAQDENLKAPEDGPTIELNVQSPEALCPVGELHSAEHTRLGDLLGHGVLEEVLERSGGHGHVVDETAFSSDKSGLNGGENFSVAMEVEETGGKQYRAADNHYVEGLTQAAKVEEEAYVSVDTALSERALKQGLDNENDMQLNRNEDADCNIQEGKLEMHLAEESTQSPAVKPENSGSQDFELTGYETALFLGDKFGDEAGKADFETSERCWWISSTTDYSRKGGEDGMEQAVGDHIISEQGCDSIDFPVLEKSAVCDKSELNEKKVALDPCEAKYEDVIHFEHFNAFEEDTGKVECGVNGENDSIDQQGCDFSDKDDSARETVAVSADFIEPCRDKNEDVVHSEPSNVFEEDIGRDECVMKDEKHSMDQAEKDILEDLMKEDEMRLGSMDDDTLEGDGNKDVEDQVTAAYSKMFSMMPDDMFITADAEGTSEIANHNAENMQSDDLGVTTQVFATSKGPHPTVEKLKECTLAEESIDGNAENGEKETFEDPNHAISAGNVDNLEDETASLDDQPMIGIIQELQEDEALDSSMEDNRMVIENQQSCNGEPGAQLTIPIPEMSATVMNGQYETSDMKGILKKDEAMPQQEETKDARRQEVNMSCSKEPASLMNHRKRSIMIHGTPRRPIITSDMKENSAAHARKEVVADATAQRPLARRKALGELPRM